MFPKRLLLGLLLVAQSQAITYWIDGSCSGKVTDEVIQEVKDMAKSASDKIGNGDENMKSQWKIIMKVDLDTATAGKTAKAFDVIADMTAATDLKTAHVRIFCDNDSAAEDGTVEPGAPQRWIYQPNVKGAGKKKRNKRLPKKEAKYYDQFNFMERSPGSFGCGDGDCQAITWISPYEHEDTESSEHNKDRQVISMCDSAFGAYKYPTLKSIPDDKDLTVEGEEDEGFSIDSLSELVSVTLFHELCHTKFVLGIPGRGLLEVITYHELYKNSNNNLDEADAYAFVGLSGLLNDRNYKWSTDPDRMADYQLDFITPPTAAASKRGVNGTTLERKEVDIDRRVPMYGLLGSRDI